MHATSVPVDSIEMAPSGSSRRGPRVLHLLASNQRRGAEVFASDLMAQLEVLGLEQTAVLLRDAGQAGLTYPVRTVILPHGVSLPVMRVDVSAVRGLRSLLRAEPFDVLMAHGGEALKLSLAARAGQHLPVVYRRIGCAPAQLVKWPRRAAFGAMMRKASRVAAIAEAVRHEAIDTFGIESDRVVTIPNAVDPQRLESGTSPGARHDIGLPPDGLVMLTLGALTWEKDPVAHVEIAARVFRAVPSALHAIVGDGPLRGAVEEMIERRGLEERTRVVGARPDAPRLLAGADVLLFASRPDGMEGMPTQLIEAGMLGVPVVAFRVAGVEEVVVDGETGLLVPAGDLDAAAAAVVKLMTDAALRGRLGSAATARCRARFDIRTVAQEYMNLYREVSSAA